MTKDKILSYIENFLTFNEDEDTEKILVDLYKYVKEQPEIIYCKDCKYRRDINKRLHYCKLSNIHVDLSHYCSNAKQGEANE